MGAVCEAVPIGRFPSPLFEPDVPISIQLSDWFHRMSLRQFGPCRRLKWQWFQMHPFQTRDAEGSVDFLEGKSAGTARLHLVPTAEEVPSPIAGHDCRLLGRLSHACRSGTPPNRAVMR
jgi:hypothetical protein